MDNTQQRPTFIFLIIGTAWLFDAMDVGLLSFIMPIVHQQWALSNSQTGLISSVSTIGMVCGGFYFGHLADRIGRKNTLIATLLTFSIGNLILAISPGFYTFLGIRFFVGMGLGGELPVAATYIADIYRGTKRSQMLILADSFWALGWLVASFLSFLLTPVLGWRGILVVTAIAGVFAIVLRKHIHETAPKSTGTQHWLVSLKTTFKPWTLMLWLAWFMVMFSYYGMFMWLPSIMVDKGYGIVNSFGYTTIIVVAQLPGYLCASWLAKRIRVKYVFAIYMLGTAFGAIMFGQSASALLIVISGCVLSFFNLGAYGAIIALTPELYAHNIRGTMTGMAQGIGRIGAIFGPLLIGVLMDHQISISIIFVIFMVSLLIGSIAVLALPSADQQPNGEVTQ
ncbi:MULTISPECIES: MFS transporter [Lactobacillaceae]|jgi:putative MFS transporter|uniref:MFS transporter n=1 Tax=Lactobacillus helveticus TaxID=1587 RepID=A0AAC8WA05_LACHE|nr:MULTISPECIES: MFS transporter [Lactobacillaceae]ALI53343.1 MFS transporter [Lactobacillus helveticus]AZI18932.1 MFS transporter [Limosilactobacillus fermentum]KAB1954738.1 MFS transporter [Limosilactobacillus fermentum]KZT83196.1 Niacin transporter NiaP [Lactiplantibacillus plantarum]KZT93877.1 Niacin transporter NiaP [Lactiplantibacillus plantarum]